MSYQYVKYHIVVFTIFIASCGLTNQHVYKLYPGDIQPDSEVVTLQFGSGVYEATIDGMKIKRSDYDVIKLQPGEHTLHWGATFLVSVLIDADGYDSSEISDSVQLKAGHTYTLHSDRTTGHGYKMYLWMTDDTADEIVAGEKKP